MSFNEKTIWITGASSGIGEALSYAFAEAGANLILSSRREDQLDRVRKGCARSDRHRIVPIDLADPSSIGQAVASVVGRGPIDILVNNGGVSQRSTTVETSIDVDRRIMEVNYFGTIALTKALLPFMIERKAGHVVVISSVAGKLGAPNRSAYSASKHALHGFFDVLRSEVHGAGIDVTMVCPGYINTDIARNALQADGTPKGVGDPDQENGMSAEQCAKQIVKAVRRKKEEVYIGGTEVYGVYLKRYFPNLLSRILRKRNT